MVNQVNEGHLRTLISVVCFLLSTSFLSAQDENRYFVYFKNKGAATNEYSLSSPNVFLSQRALDRRSHEGIPIDSTDLPVNGQYVNELSQNGSNVFFTSKWLNGALIEASENIISVLSQLTFVDSIRLLANGTRLSFDQEVVEIPTSFEEPPSISGDSDIQLLMLGADIMHMDSILGEGMLIAVFDNGFTGVDTFSPFQHLWENDQIIATRDFVENSGNVFQFGSHGTSVFSTIGAWYENESMSYYGIANQADFVLCVTEDNAGENTLEEYNWIIAAEYADSLGVEVINSSLGYRDFDIASQDYDFDELDGNTSVITKAAEMAASKGMIVATSAGNSGTRTAPANLISHPGDADSILVVGSVDVNFNRSSFSSIGPTADGRTKPDVAAFGSSTAVIDGNGAILRGSGTSFASPLIAGFAAGIWQLNPDWTSQEVIQAIKESGHQSSEPDAFLGYGVPNYSFISEGRDRTLSIRDILEDKITFYPNPFHGDRLYFKTEGQLEAPILIRIHDANGATIYEETFDPEQLAEPIELTINKIQPGLYYLILQSEKAQKIVKLINF